MKILCKLLVLCSLFSVLCSLPVRAEDAHDAVVAGSFYPKDKTTLKKAVGKYISEAKVEPIEGRIYAIVTPHAGYEYSGPVAGYAFSTVKGKGFKTVVIIAPSHKYGFMGLAILDKDSYITPLGAVAIDKELTKQFLIYDKRIEYNIQPFMKEHAAEVEIPFIQQALPGANIVVMLTGSPSYETCTLLRDSLSAVLKDRKDVLIVVSTDMSHYYPDETARRIDYSTINDVCKFDPESLFLKFTDMQPQDKPCGAYGLIGVMMAVKKLGADSVKLLEYATSGDITGDTRGVVGYAALAVYQQSAISNQPSALRDKEELLQKTKAYKETKMKGLLDAKQKKRLLEIARATLDSYIKNKKIPEFKESDKVLNEDMGAFVTLHKNGQLRGCIGNMIGSGPLYLTVRDMAVAASTQDPRFSPVTEAELKDIDIEISALSPMEKITDPDKIIMGTHGVMVRKGFRSGVYLPQVATETGWSRDEFMDSLCIQKAGLPADTWKNGSCDIYIFTAEVFNEPR